MLEKGADIEAKDENRGWTPNQGRFLKLFIWLNLFFFTFKKGYKYGHIDVAKHLSETGNDVHALKRGGYYTSLILGALYEKLFILIKQIRIFI